MSYEYLEIILFLFIIIFYEINSYIYDRINDLINQLEYIIIEIYQIKVKY
jgi:hypothetical protein